MPTVRESLLVAMFLAARRHYAPFERFAATWREHVRTHAFSSDVDLVLVESPYRSLVARNQSAVRVRAALLFRPGTIVTSVPYPLRSA